MPPRNICYGTRIGENHTFAIQHDNLIRKIISGGQTGVDRAALDAASIFGVCHGGWCPRGRRAADGTVPLTYPLRETPKRGYGQRTEWNVRDSDGTLVLCIGEPVGGSALTVKFAKNLGKPFLVLDPSAPASDKQLLDWLQDEHVSVLNIAGPSEERVPGIYESARSFLLHALERLALSGHRAL